MTEPAATPLRDLVRAELDKAASEGRSIPSIRALRATVQRGSFTAITTFVKEWRLEHAPRTDHKPEGFDEASGKSLSSAVWAVISPAVTAQIEAAQKAAAEQLAIEREETAKLTALAEEKLKEAEAIEASAAKKESEVQHLREENARLQGELASARQEIANAKSDHERLNSALNKAIESAASATATLAAFKKMFPLLNAPASATLAAHSHAAGEDPASNRRSKTRRQAP